MRGTSNDIGHWIIRAAVLKISIAQGVKRYTFDQLWDLVGTPKSMGTVSYVFADLQS